MLKLCANDKLNCIKSKQIYEGVCKVYSLGDYFPDLEGDVGNINDGSRAVNLVAEKLDPGKRRILAPKKVEPRFGFLKINKKGADLSKDFSHKKKTGYKYRMVDNAIDRNLNHNHTTPLSLNLPVNNSHVDKSLYSNISFFWSILNIILLIFGFFGM